MPRWLKATLLAVALLTVIAFIAPPAVAIGQRRRRDLRAAGGRGATAGGAPPSKTARIVQADHERLIVTYSVSDNTVYLLTPPGEDPRAVLRAARLVLPEDTYEELAGHLGAPLAGSGSDAAATRRPDQPPGGGCRGAVCLAGASVWQVPGMPGRGMACARDGPRPQASYQAPLLVRCTIGSAR